MLYILDQRLRAQNISKEKATKVLHDIVNTMLNKRFVDELFKPQELYSKKALRTVFDRLAHASIMRLNAASMDKLYDLMVMAFKYQVCLCLRPNDVLLATLNHMDAIRSFVQDSPNIRELVDYTYRLLAQHYANLTPGEFMVIRQTLLNFFQDMHIRVSVFLRDKVQNQNGRFVISCDGPVPYGSDIPGTIQTYSNGRSSVSRFPVEGNYKESKRQGSYDLMGDRVTKLGKNMYSNSSSSKVTEVKETPKVASSPSADVDMTPNPAAKAQLDLLATLIGSGAEKKGTKQEIRLNLFNTDKEEEEAAVQARPTVQEQGSKVINIDASQTKQNRELARIMGELTFDSGAGGRDDDLLDLMDSAQ